MTLHLNDRIERHVSIEPSKFSLGLWSHAKHTCLAYVGEIASKKLFEQNNFDVLHTGNFRDYDLLLNDTIKIEVKISRKRKTSKYWQFCVNRANHCQSTNADYILLIAIGDYGICTLYLVPARVFAGNKTFKLWNTGTNNKSKIAKYRITDYSAIVL